MHDDWLTPDVADQLLDGEFASAGLADLAGMVSDLRSVAGTTPTPHVRGALAEYVGVNLAPTEPSATPPVDAAVRDAVTDAPQPRRKTVFAEAATFAGTMAGKLFIGGVAVCAAATGAHVSGVADVPGLPGGGEIVVAGQGDGTPAELAFTDKGPNGRFGNPWLLAQDAGEEPTGDSGDEDDPSGEKGETEEPKEVVDVPEQKDIDGEPQQPAPAKSEPETEEAKTEPKHEKPKHEEPSEKDQMIAALEAQLHADKEAVYAAAWAEMEPIHAEKGALIEEKNGILWQLEQARNEAKAPLYAALEETDDPELKAQIEAELMAIYHQWEIDRDAVLAEYEPAIWELKQQLGAIEAERDAQIEQLFKEFHAAVAAL